MLSSDDVENWFWNLWDRGTWCLDCRLIMVASTLRRKARVGYSWVVLTNLNENSLLRKAHSFGLGSRCWLFRFAWIELSSDEVVTWLILPVVICLSQRLSHACLSINKFVLWNCEWLIKSVIVYLMIPCYMDNCGNSRANTCIKALTSGRGVFIR